VLESAFSAHDTRAAMAATAAAGVATAGGARRPGLVRIDRVWTSRSRHEPRRCRLDRRRPRVVILFEAAHALTPFAWAIITAYVLHPLVASIHRRTRLPST
jgi:hypothetical protein